MEIKRAWNGQPECQNRSCSNPAKVKENGLLVCLAHTEAALEKKRQYWRDYHERMKPELARRAAEKAERIELRRQAGDVLRERRLEAARRKASRARCEKCGQLLPKGEEL